jgi:hypothetical protein
MLQHGIVPAAGGVVLGLLAAVPFALHGSPVVLLTMPLCALPFTAAALYGACRGPARTQLMFLGGGSPVGSPGPLIFLAWYAAGPLAAVTVLSLALSLATPATTTALALLLAAALLTVTANAADKLIR